MGRVVAAVGREAEAGDGGLDALAQAHQRRSRGDAGPQDAHPAARGKVADTLQRERERLRPDVGERVSDLGEGGAVDLADEAEREVHLFRALPARPRQAAAHPLEALADVLRQGEGDEEPDHLASPPLSRPCAG